MKVGERFQSRQRGRPGGTGWSHGDNGGNGATGILDLDHDEVMSPFPLFPSMKRPFPSSSVFSALSISSSTTPVSLRPSPSKGRRRTFEPSESVESADSVILLFALAVAHVSPAHRGIRLGWGAISVAALACGQEQQPRCHPI